MREGEAHYPLAPHVSHVFSSSSCYLTILMYLHYTGVRILTPVCIGI